MKRLYLIIIIIMSLVFQSISVLAESTSDMHNTLKAHADSLYAAQKYEDAAKAYESLLNDGESAVVYYNLGNSYFRMHEIGRAILNYERSLRLDPSDKDTRFNLSFARSKTVDKVEPAENSFITDWLSGLVNSKSTYGWGKLAIVAFALGLLFVLLYLFGRKLLLRKIGFFAAIFMLVIVLVSNGCAYYQQVISKRLTYAIVMFTSDVKSSPSESGSTLFQLHEGTKAKVIDNSMKQWAKIELPDGKTGWLPNKNVTVI